MTLSYLIQAAQAVATASTDGLGSYLVQFAVAIILALNVWMVRTVNATRGEVTAITYALFGRRGDNGIERTVEEHSAELLDHENRITQGEGRLERIDPDLRVGPPDRRQS